MNNLLLPRDGAMSFLRNAQSNGYSMEPELIRPIVGAKISEELKDAGFLVDYTELVSTSVFEEKGMRFTDAIFKALNAGVSLVEGEHLTHLPLFSVRVFEPGVYGTTVHRNHPSIGPWAIGITLKGTAPFNVYTKYQLPEDTIQPLRGDGNDPIPLDSMEASAGSGWTLYTRETQTPHSSGIVESDIQRELLIFYGMQ